MNEKRKSSNPSQIKGSKRSKKSRGSSPAPVKVALKEAYTEQTLIKRLSHSYRNHETAEKGK